MNLNYKKVIVIGNNGSGKSHFSKRLSEITKLPLVHLDLLYWQDECARKNREEWAKIQKELVANDEWILDGMHISTLEIRFASADAIYFLDFETSFCVESAKKRQLEEKSRSDFPNELDKHQKDFDEFIKGIVEFEEKRRPKILELHEKYPSKDFIVFKTRIEVDEYIKSISK